MVDTETVLSSYDIFENHIYAGYKLTFIETSRQSISKFEEFNINMHLIFENIIHEDNYDIFYDYLVKKLFDRHIISSKQASYECIFLYPVSGDIKTDNNLNLELFLVANLRKLW